ncbi:bifunctional 4-hydroxy-2-oxoglutarate aldolase/2-dehydro-3-deoxy-phosphogluconate aldolase [Epidermidibacterium keratini]|uniref:Bifunctional 4-hydroxy-2-oxoglutarate aldolase/2-dehydro-3-deoxy-phosphogluconate aldolase n=1 Tax=Epidermidibacterium keratini TaxID=1891644 RepID=A0A7L4YLB0_9ACTN|nr:bifunctional 4-hydroxy-2-oxoglutarate aldolase/2-dehydro-3-deoxy-phosphogluconate aldolase [Epidermidibacterium keratini]QHB99618.1 bifunctional 4-hydroxy-2-oxoglutarate aldolase/2-dehydro-3-deoxy-phosphogluconate aldolase [Epidermidibacterium keratini]
MGERRPSEVVDAVRRDRVIAVVRADRIGEPTTLAASLVAGGIRIIELTFTTPGVLDALSAVSKATHEIGAMIGAGTIRSCAQAEDALNAGASFLVTPGLGAEAREIAELAHAAGAAMIHGAFTATEVMAALSAGADIVKIFPARTGGPQHLADLLGPFPDVPLLPSGGINESNAAAYLASGACAVTAGTSVVSPEAVAAGRWDEITTRATELASAVRGGAA